MHQIIKSYQEWAHLVFSVLKKCFYAFLKVKYHLYNAEYLSEVTVLSQQWRLQLSGNSRVQMQQGNKTLYIFLYSHLIIGSHELIKIKRLKGIISLYNVIFDKQIVFVIEPGINVLFIFIKMYQGNKNMMQGLFMSFKI